MGRKMRPCFIALLSLSLAAAWAGESPGAQGIPVSSDLVQKKCTGCHKNDGGLVSRISYVRQAPEAWEDAPARPGTAFATPRTRRASSMEREGSCDPGHS